MMPMPILPQPYTTRSTCRACAGLVDPILSLGNLLLPAFPIDDAERATLPRAPIELVQCAICGLAQLAHTVTPDLLYRQYWYQSGINELMRAELLSVVGAVRHRVPLDKGSVVLDIGANDGTLLSHYATLCHPQAIPWRVAYEPAANLAEACRQHANALYATYFPPDADLGAGSSQSVDVITSLACFYDTDDPVAWVQAIDHLLTLDGLWICQLQDLAGMVRTTGFDNLCHEHLTYWSLASFELLLVRAGVNLHVTEVEWRAINGGSLRIYVRRMAMPIHASVDIARTTEAPHIGWRALERFAWRVGQTRQQITATVDALRSAGLTIDLYAASTKGATLLQLCALGPEALRQAWERSPAKVGRQTVTGVPIVSEEAGRADPPACLLVGAWQFREVFLQREAAFLHAGGSLLVPLPELDLVTAKVTARVEAR